MGAAKSATMKGETRRRGAAAGMMIAAAAGMTIAAAAGMTIAAAAAAGMTTAAAAEGTTGAAVTAEGEGEGMSEEKTQNKFSRK